MEGWGGVLDRKNELELRPFRVVSVPSGGVSNVCEAKKILVLVKYEERLSEMLKDKQARLGRTSYLHREYNPAT